MFIEAAKDPTTEIGIHYKKLERRESEDSDVEWTQVMGVFLARLARRCGYFQEWEKHGRLDFAWYEDDRINPTIAIEHENWFMGVHESELPKLLKVRADLKILITYAYRKKGEAKVLADSLEAPLQAAKFKGKFMLVVGTEKLVQPNEWRPFIWDDSLNTLVETSEGRSQCKECGNRFFPWGPGQDFCLNCELSSAAEAPHSS
jgi:hypothetical protein